jgi:CHAP domain
MSLALTLARIAEIDRSLAPPAPAAASATPAPSSFASTLQGALAPVATAATASPLGTAPFAPIGTTIPGGGGPAMVQIAEAEVGQAEQPPGSNDSPRIAQYRQATAGSGVGPWCAYFVSWAAKQAGTPLGDQGQGFGSVDELYAWAQRSGRAVANGPGVVPKPGDLIVFNEHIGLVEAVQPGGSIQTIEGNSSDQVSRRVHSAGDAVGYVRMS